MNTDQPTPLGDQSSFARRFCVGTHTWLTLIDQPQATYSTISEAEFIAYMLESPYDGLKTDAPFMLMSSYNGYDARSHEAQREHGSFHAFAFDIDKHHADLGQIKQVVATVVGGSRFYLHSTASASHDSPRYRVIVPSRVPIHGSWYAALNHALCMIMTLAADNLGVAVEFDPSAAREGQIMFMPTRGIDGFYHSEVIDGEYYEIGSEVSELGRRLKADIDEYYSRKVEAHESYEKLSYKMRGLIGDFNRTHTVADELRRAGFVRRGMDWHHPEHQTTKSYATRDWGDGGWHSRSASLTAAKLGTSRDGSTSTGDAFAIRRWAEHGNDDDQAIKAYIESLYTFNLGVATVGHGRSIVEGLGYTSDQTVGFSLSFPAATIDLVAWPDEPDLSYRQVEARRAPKLELTGLISQSLQELITDIANAAECPEDYAFGLLLSFGAAYAGDNFSMKVREGWEEPLIIWTMLVGNPSHKKSPAFRKFMEPATAFNLAVQSGKIGGPTKPEDHTDHVPMPIVSDTTVEAIGGVMAKQPRGVLIARDELAAWVEGMTRYSGSSDRPFWAEAYNGDASVISRIKRGNIVISRAAACIAGGIQPDTLYESLLKGRNDGVMARFLTFYPERRKSRVEDNMIRDRFDDVYRILSRLYLNENRGVLTLSDEARQAHVAFGDYCNELEDSADDKFMIALLGKLAGMSVRIAGVLHMIEWALSGQPKMATVVDKPRLEAVFSFLTNYVLAMAYRTYGAGEGSQEVLKAKQFITTMISRGKASFKTSDIMRNGIANLKTKRQLDPVLEVLLDAKVIAKTRNATGGRPEETFHIHPKLLT